MILGFRAHPPRGFRLDTDNDWANVLFHHAMEVIPALSWTSTSPAVSRHTQLSSGVRTRVVSKRGGLADVLWTPDTQMRVQKRNDGPPKQERRYKNGTTVQKVGTMAHSPKPPFYKNSLAFPLDKHKTGGARGASEVRLGITFSRVMLCSLLII